MISLPRKWAKQYGLKKGDELELTEKGKELVLTTEKAKEEESETVVEIKDVDKFMGRLIFAPYRFGYNKVEIRYTCSSVAPKIQECLDQLLGFEIVEQGSNFMKVEMVAKEMETEFEKMLRRILLMTADMSKELVKASSENDKDKLRDIASMETMNNKLTNFCERVLTKHGYSENKKANFVYCTTWVMEQVVDNIKTICLTLSEQNTISKELISVLDGFAQYITRFSKIFYKHSNDDLWTFREEHYTFMKQVEKLKSKNARESKVIMLVNSSTEQIRHLTLSLL